MESIYVSQKDMLEICQDGDKYFLRYPTFNITCPEVIREIPKEAADSYMSGEHMRNMVFGNLKKSIHKMNPISSSSKIILPLF